MVHNDKENGSINLMVAVNDDTAQDLRQMSKKTEESEISY